jgi:two-component system sensor histidine kinase BaeS
MGINKLWLKLAAIAAITAGIGIIAASILIHRLTDSGFQQYLQIARGMNQMMGGGPNNMMGVNETAYLNSVNHALWLAGIIAVALAVVVAIAFSRQITAPLRRLSAVAGKVARGDLSGRVTSHSSDEVGALSKTFNRMVESLSENQEMRRKLMGDLAHEMGTPLAVIQSNLEGMMDGVVETSPETLASLHQESLLLSRLVKDLRTLAQVEAHRLSLAPVSADLGALVSSIVTASEPETKRKNISLTLKVDADLPPVMMDPDRVSQVVSNLLSNALRYSSAGGSINLRVGKSDDKHSLLVSVADTGQGIAQEDLPHIFDRYYQGMQAKEKRVGGSGIGLTVVKELVEAHKGRVWVQSAPGQGSTFYFTLPVPLGGDSRAFD